MDEMATGNSKTKWNGNGTARLIHDVPAYSSSVNLTYEGKRDEPDILSTQPAGVKVLWQPEHEHERQNRLYYGDNLPILASLLHDPTVCGKVRLVYIDPPFATKSVFQSRAQNDAYQDLLDDEMDARGGCSWEMARKLQRPGCSLAVASYAFLFRFAPTLSRQVNTDIGRPRWFRIN